MTNDTPARSTTARIDGTWSMAVETPVGTHSAEIEFRTDGDVLNGEFRNKDETVPLHDGKVDGDAIEFKVKRTKPMPLTFTVTAQVRGDTMEGHAKAGFLPRGALTGRRIGD